MTVPTLEVLIQSENYDYSVTLLKSSENTYNSKMKALTLASLMWILRLCSDYNNQRMGFINI